MAWNLRIRFPNLFSAKRENRSLRVEVRFFGFVRDVVSASSVALGIPQSATLRDLLDLLAKRFGERLRERLLTRTGELEANVQLFVGDTQATSR